jgi:hypothetical protein
MPILSMDTWVLLGALLLVGSLSVGSALRTAGVLRRQGGDLAEIVGLLQRTYHLQARALTPGIVADRQARILEALLQSGYYNTRESRDNLVAAACPPELQRLLSRNNIARIDLQTLLRDATRWEPATLDVLRAVLEEAIATLNGSASGKQLQAIRAEIQAEQLGHPDEKELQ